MTRPDLNKSLFHLYPWALTFTGVIALAVFQNFIAIMLSPTTPTLARGVLVAKEVYLALVLGISILLVLARGRFVLQPYVMATVVFLMYLLAYGAVSPYFNLLSLRQLLIIPLFILFGYCFVGKTKLEHIQVYLFSLIGLLCISSYLERFLLYTSGEPFWVSMGINAYMKVKGFEAWAFGPGGTPGNFYTYDFYNLIGLPVRRMVSLFLAEPTLLGQLLVLPVLYSVLARKWFFFALTASVLVLSFSKGGLLGVFVAYGLYYVQTRRTNLDGLILKGFLVILGLCGAAFVVLLGVSGAVNSIAVHLQGLAHNIVYLLEHPLGRGIGGSGNFAALAGNPEAAAGESYLGTLIGQLGFPGLIAYALLFWTTWKLPSQPGAFATSIKYCVLATLVTGIASESAISYVGTGYLFALLPFLHVHSNTVVSLPSRQPNQSQELVKS